MNFCQAIGRMACPGKMAFVPSPAQGENGNLRALVWHGGWGPRHLEARRRVLPGLQAKPTRALMSHVPSSVVHQEEVVAPAKGTTTNSDTFRPSRSSTPPWSSRSNHVAFGAESSPLAFTSSQWHAR